MIKFLNSKNLIKKFQAAQQPSLIKMNLNDYNSFNTKAGAMLHLPIKILSGQILAMAEQDNSTLIGKKLDIFT